MKPCSQEPTTAPYFYEKYYQGDKIKQDEMVHGVNKKCIQSSSQNHEGEERLRDLGTDARTIMKCILTHSMLGF